MSTHVFPSGTSSGSGADAPDEWIRYSVTVQRPSSADLSDLPRAEKYRTLKASNSRIRDAIVAWLGEHDLIEHVASIAEPTVFNILFVEGSPALAGELIHAPGVVSVTTDDEFTVDLLGDEF